MVLSEAGEKPDLLIHEQLLLVLVHTLTACYSTGEKNRNRNKRQPTANSQERARFQKPWLNFEIFKFILLGTVAYLHLNQNTSRSTMLCSVKLFILFIWCDNRTPAVETNRQKSWPAPPVFSLIIFFFFCLRLELPSNHYKLR